MIQQELYLAERVMEGLGQQVKQAVGPSDASAPVGVLRRQRRPERGRQLLSWAALWLVSFGGRLVGWGLPYHRPLDNEA